MGVVPGPLQTVGATTGGAVTAAYRGWSGSVVNNVSRCQSGTYGRSKGLCKMAMESFKTGPFNRSGTSPLRRRHDSKASRSPALSAFVAPPGGER